MFGLGFFFLLPWEVTDGLLHPQNMGVSVNCSTTTYQVKKKSRTEEQREAEIGTDVDDGERAMRRVCGNAFW